MTADEYDGLVVGGDSARRLAPTPASSEDFGVVADACSVVAGRTLRVPGPSAEKPHFSDADEIDTEGKFYV